MPHLSIKVVCETGHKLRLNGVLTREQREVVGELVMGGEDGAMAKLVKLRPSCTAKDLHDVQDAQVHKCALLGVIQLSAL